MNAKAAKAMRRRAQALTEHLPDTEYLPRAMSGKTTRLGECRRGAYQALKRGAVRHVAFQS